MKKTAILFLIISVTFVNLNAQFSIGITGGVNLSKTRFINFDHLNAESVLYYFAGIVPGYQLNEKFSLITDIQFSQKGYKNFDSISQVESKVRFTYLDLMPQLEYRFHKNISVGGGFNLGIKMSEGYNNGNGDWIDNEDFEYAKSIDFGLIAAMKYHISNFHLLGRVNYGLANISELTFTDVNGQTLEDTKMKNTNFQLGMGYTFQ